MQLLSINKELEAPDNGQHNPESVVQEIKRNTRRKFSAEEKIRIVLDGLKGEESLTVLCR